MPKCPICGRIKNNKETLINHIENEHMNEIPENMSTAQFIYYKNHGRDYGLCRICGSPTPWNEKAGKPSQLCGKQECKDKVKEIAQARMLKVYGKVSLMNDIKHQEKMLSHRKISGTYIWSDHKHKFTYTGKYEKFAIEWLDKVMDLNPDKIQMPGPIVPYEFNGEIKYWITDIYLEDFNLIIEIKAGKDENTHPGFEHNRELEAAKDESMKKQNEFNYIKITHKSMLNLVKLLSEIRMNNINSIDRKTPYIMINESIDLCTPSYPEITPIIDFLKTKGCKIIIGDNDDMEKSKFIKDLNNLDKFFKISYEGADDLNINDIFVSNNYYCYDKPRTSKLIYAKYKNDKTNGSYNIDVYIDYIRKTITFTVSHINENIKLTNNEIDLICESIMNEYTMSIANLSPIVTNKPPVTENKEENLLSKLKNVKSKQETIQPPNPQDNIFSPNNTVSAPDPFDSSNNFEENNEEVRIDIENDPYDTKPNDFANIVQSNINSYFN